MVSGITSAISEGIVCSGACVLAATCGPTPPASLPADAGRQGCRRSQGAIQTPTSDPALAPNALATSARVVPPRPGRALGGRGGGLQPYPGHQAADPGLRAQRLAGGTGGLDRGEVPRLERLCRGRR